MHHDEKITATLQAVRELKGDYAPLTRLQCVVAALWALWREAPVLDASLPRDERIASLKRVAADAIQRARTVSP